MPATEQLITRIDPEISARLAAIAAGSNQTVSEIVRKCIDAQLDTEEAEAKKAAASKVPLTDAAIEGALHDAIRSVNRSQSLVIHTHELLSPKSYAIFKLLSTIWTTDKIGEKVRDKIAAQLVVQKQTASSGDDDSTSRPVKSYPRRASQN